MGRTFEAAAIYRAQSMYSEVLRYLWPDSIVHVYRANADWYQLSEGYVQRTMIQPMTPYSPPRNPPLTSPPFWGEVAAPIAVVRQWCAPDAPLVTRIGHGGVAQIVDRLSRSRQGADWYGVTTQDDYFLGWTQAIFWRPVHNETSSAFRPTLHIDQRAQVLTGYDDSEIVFRTPISTRVNLVAGTYVVTERYPTGAPIKLPDYSNDFHGAPWRVHFGEGYELSGVYWHNRFGSPVPGPAVQVPTQVSHWLYNWLRDHAIITVA